LCSCQRNGFTKIDIVENIFDFGQIKSTDTVYHTFTIKNITETPFVIEKALAGCGCTTIISFSDTTYYNEKATVDIRFVPDYESTGVLDKIILLQCNAQKGVVRLHITGIVQ